MPSTVGLFITLAFFASLFSLPANAAELRGQFTYSSKNLTNPKISVWCNGEASGSFSLGSSGTYAVRGLPTGQDCSFRVMAGGIKSRSIPFSTTRSVTIYSGKLRKRNDKVLVLKK